jgi:putative MFS transporter
MEYYDLLGVGSWLPAVAQAYKANTVTTSFNLLSVAYVGAFVGAVVLSPLGDRIGRRSIVIYNLMITSVAYWLTPFAPTIETLGVLRLIAGIGTGAEMPLMVSLLSEFVPAKYRGRTTSRVQALAFLSLPFSAYTASLLQPTHYLLLGWQWMFIIGGLGLIVVIPLRFYIPESVRWLESMGRTEEAEKTLAKMEGIATKEKGPLPEPQTAVTVTAPKPKTSRDPRQLFGVIDGINYRKRTIMLWIMQFLQTGFTSVVSVIATTVLVAKGFTIVRSLEYAAVGYIMYPVGYLINQTFSDSLKFDRKWQLVLGFFVYGIVGFSFGVLTNSPLEAMVVGGGAVLCQSMIYSSPLLTYPVELYPTRLRTTAAGWAYSLSRIGNSVWLVVLPLTLQLYGVLGCMIALVIMAWIAALDVAILGPRANQARLEILSR